MNLEILKFFGKVAGIGGIALGVFLILFSSIIQKKIFPQLTKAQAYKTIRLIMILIWSVTITGIATWLFLQIKINESKRNTLNYSPIENSVPSPKPVVPSPKPVVPSPKPVVPQPKPVVPSLKVEIKVNKYEIIAEGAGISMDNDEITAKIRAERNAMEKIQEKLINILSESPYGFNMDDATQIFEEGEIQNIKYEKKGKEVTTYVKYRIKIP